MSERFERRTRRDGVVDEHHPPAGHPGAADAWFVVFVPHVSGLADERERQVTGQRHRGGKRDPTGLGADNDLGAQSTGERHSACPEVMQQARLAVRVLDGERVQREAGLHVPVRDAWAYQVRHGCEPRDEVHPRLWYGGETSDVGRVDKPHPVRVRQTSLVGIHALDGRAPPASSRPSQSLALTLDATQASDAPSTKRYDGSSTSATRRPGGCCAKTASVSTASPNNSSSTKPSTRPTPTPQPASPTTPRPDQPWREGRQRRTSSRSVSGRCADQVMDQWFPLG